MNDGPPKADFCIEIDFDRHSGEASRVFRTMAGLIETLQTIDRTLITSIDSKIEPVLLLEDVEAGSIRAWLSNEVKMLDDATLKSGDWKKVIGLYLVRGKQFIVKMLEGKAEISDASQIDEIQIGLLELAKETRVNQLPYYAPIEKAKLLEGVEGITTALSHLSEKDKALYKTGTESATFNAKLNYAPKEIERLITRESLVNETVFIVKVKKPDYLGDSMWELRHGSNPVDAKILDREWLVRFQSRGIDVRPGDSLRVKMRITVDYDFDSNPISTKHEIVQVIEVLSVTPPEQIDFTR